MPCLTLPCPAFLTGGFFVGWKEKERGIKMVIRRGARAESLFFSFFFRVCNRAAGLAWLEGLEDFRRPETQKKKSLHQQSQGRSGDAWRRQPPHHTDSNSSPQYYLILSYPSPSVRLYLPIADERVCLIDGPCPREPHPLPPPPPLAAAQKTAGAPELARTGPAAANLFVESSH